MENQSARPAPNPTPTQAPPSHGGYDMKSTPPPVAATAAISTAQLLNYILRAAAVVLTFIAVVVMGAAKQTATEEAVDPFTGDTVTATLGKAKSTTYSAFAYFIVANVVVLAYSMISLAMSFINKTGSSGFLEMVLTMADVVVMGLLFTSNGAASAIILVAEHGQLVAEHGQQRFYWRKICNYVSGFCASVKAAIVLSMFASVAFLLLVLLRLILLHKNNAPAQC
ncbi:CASP-like protein 1E1 [Canna indica]|uniref:CASP-like protein n=1 Tax=Canna indica TaxID=4628 RepID=A0AAQ3L5C5_9LILI|nr:CASP-like protein 1E1 [Canna indica]